MSSPGNELGLWVGQAGLSELGRYRELVLNWLLAKHDGVVLRVFAPSELQDGLAWMGLDFERGPDQPAGGHRCIRSVPAAEDREVLAVGPLQGGVSLQSLREAGFVPEVVLSALAQSGWRGRSPDFTNVTRSELLVRFTPEGLLQDPQPFNLEEWQNLNRDRLHELAPAELLELLTPFLASRPPQHELEAAILMHCEEVDNLVELARAVML